VYEQQAPHSGEAATNPKKQMTPPPNPDDSGHPTIICDRKERERITQ